MKSKGLGCCLWEKLGADHEANKNNCKQQIPKGINAFVNQGMFPMCMPIQIAPCSALSMLIALLMTSPEYKIMTDIPNTQLCPFSSAKDPYFIQYN